VIVQTFYGPALELLNEIRQVALVSDYSMISVNYFAN